MKRKHLLVILISALLLLFSSFKSKEAPAMADLVAMWKRIYGEEMIIQLPGRDEYALLKQVTDSEAYPEFRYEILCPIDEVEYDYIWYNSDNDLSLRDAYAGDLFSMIPDKRSYSPDESVTYTITNNSGRGLYYEVGFLLEIKIEDQWYRVLGIPSAGKGRLPRIIPQGSTKFEFTTADIVGELSKSYRYNEELGEYERYPRWSEVSWDTYKLIPGQYRYTAHVSFEDDYMEMYNLGFEFEIEE